MKIKAIILGGQEAWKVASEFTAKQYRRNLYNIYNLPVRDDDAYDFLFEGPSKLQKAGRQVCYFQRKRRTGNS
jgi:hypothetical protein